MINYIKNKIKNKLKGFILSIIKSDEAKEIYVNTNKACNLSLETNVNTSEIYFKSIYNLNYFKHKQLSENENISKIAIFGILPPEISGIAIYNARTFGINDIFHVFSNFNNSNDFKIAVKKAENEYKNNFFCIDSYSIARSLFLYKKKIFVLGNSPNQAPYLDLSVKETDKNNSYLYCHEIGLSNLLACYLGIKTYNNIAKLAYPELSDKIPHDTESAEIINVIEYGFRIILMLTGITNIIVNNGTAKNIIIKEIKGTVFENTVTITTFFLPFPDNKPAKINPVSLSKEVINIGTFGVPNDKDKATSTIIDAIILLNEKYDIKAKCVIAGYCVKDYINKNISKDKLKYISWFSDTTDEQMDSIMEQIDIAIQLRNYPRGESSACIQYLLQKNKIILTTKNFIEDYLEKYCITLETHISSEDLAKELFEIINNKNTFVDTSEIINKYSYKNLSEMIINI